MSIKFPFLEMSSDSDKEIFSLKGRGEHSGRITLLSRLRLLRGKKKKSNCERSRSLRTAQRKSQ